MLNTGVKNYCCFQTFELISFVLRDLAVNIHQAVVL